MSAGYVPRLRDHRETIEALALTPVIDRASTEHVLHELAHAATLRLDVRCCRLTRLVSDRIGIIRGPCWTAMSVRRADWNEIRTTAVELRMAALLGWSVGRAWEVIQGNTMLVDTATAGARAEALVWCESTYRDAVRALELAPRILAMWDEEAEAEGVRKRIPAKEQYWTHEVVA